MRIKNSIKNIYMGITTQVVIILLGFISRKIFINNLGIEYLGINGLLTNILSMLSLVEGGIGLSIVYNLYKPLADGDKIKVTALVQLYKKCYIILSVSIFIISILIYPLLDVIMKNKSNVVNIELIYYIFIFKNIVSYLNAHKWSLINADQKGYIISKYNLMFKVITTVVNIIILQLTQNYILFLTTELVIFIIQNIFNGKIVNNMYPYIKTKEKYEVDISTKSNLIINVKSLFLHKIGAYCVFGTDNVLISLFININTVGLYSNYIMITGQLSELLTQLLNGIAASVGNLIATESKEKAYEIFKITYLVNFWIGSISVIFLYNLLEPFINWWIGSGFLLDKLSFLIILVNFYLTGLRSSITMFKARAGMFRDDKYVPLIEAAINLVLSITLAKYLGLKGILIGTTISTISIPLWLQSKIVYNKIFDVSVLEYFKKYILYLILTILTGIITTFMCDYLVIGTTFMSLIGKGIICVIIPNSVYIFLFYKTEEFKYIWSIIKHTINKLTRRCLG
jgi:O-antigen/teichoic acid export membrane protein